MELICFPSSRKDDLLETAKKKSFDKTVLLFVVAMLLAAMAISAKSMLPDKQDTKKVS